MRLAPRRELLLLFGRSFGNETEDLALPASNQALQTTVAVIARACGQTLQAAADEKVSPPLDAKAGGYGCGLGLRSSCSSEDRWGEKGKSP